ncbi:MAG: hypothetical protein MKZ85_05480, partial [Pedosphaera sp.]|nr:hypothetical protein [Pedosphaera sp.]
MFEVVSFFSIADSPCLVFFVAGNLASPAVGIRRALSEQFNFPEFQEPVFGLYSDIPIEILDAGRGCDQRSV